MLTRRKFISADNVQSTQLARCLNTVDLTALGMLQFGQFYLFHISNFNVDGTCMFNCSSVVIKAQQLHVCLIVSFLVYLQQQWFAMCGGIICTMGHL